MKDKILSLSWFPFHADEWHQRTMDFTRTEKMYLIDLIVWQIKYNGDLPGTETLKKLCYCFTEDDMLALCECIAKYKASALHSYVKELYISQLGRANKNRKNAKKAAKKRWEKPCDRIADAMPLDEIRLEETRLEEKERYTPLSPFEDFWKAYPKKEWQDKAEEAWDEVAVSPEMVARIVDAAQLYARSLKGKEYLAKSPENWLRGKGWENQVIIPEQDKPQLTDKEKDFAKLVSNVWKIGYNMRVGRLELAEIRRILDAYGEEARLHLVSAPTLQAKNKSNLTYVEYVWKELEVKAA